MFIPSTLLLYISRKFLLHLTITIIAISSLCFLASLAETAQRMIKHNHSSFELISQMALFQTPGLVEIALPFIFLISAVSCFFSMAKRHELNAARTSGISAWLLILPPMMMAALSGVLVFTLFNPASATLTTNYKELKELYIRNKTSLLVVSDTGLWLRQNDGQRQSVIHALRVDEKGVMLSDVTIFLYENEDRFISRLDARSAELKDGHWDLRKVWMTQTSAPPQFMESYRQTTSLTPDQIHESVATPDTIPFWKLSRFIELAKAAGFSVVSYEFQWHALVAMPAFLASMVLAGMAASLFFNARQGGEIRLAVSAILFGFFIYGLIFLGRKLIATAEIPPLFLVWTPISTAFFTGLILFLQKEEG